MSYNPVALNSFKYLAGRVTVNSEQALIKYSNSAYNVMLSNYTDGLLKDRDELDVLYNYSAMPIVGTEMAAKLRSAVEYVNSTFYNTNNAGDYDATVNAAIRYIRNSFVAFSMLCAIARTQNGLFVRDEDGLYLAPILFNHEEKSYTLNDWSVAGNQFVESIELQSLDTISDILSSREISFNFSIGNDTWANQIVGPIMADIMLTPNQLEMARHLFTNTFLRTDSDYVVAFATLWPSSQLVVNDTPETVRLEGYENPGQTFDNATNLKQLLAYVNNFTTECARLRNQFPQLQSVFNLLNLTNGIQSDGNWIYDFTRDMSKLTIGIIGNQNIEHFIMATSQPTAQVDFGELPWAANKDLCFAPRNLAVTISNGTLQYQNTVTLLPDYEALCRGWILPLDFAFLRKQINASTNSELTYYSYQPLINIMLSTDTGVPVEYHSELFSCQSNLIDGEAILPLGKASLSAISQDSITYSVIISPSLSTFTINPADSNQLQVTAADQMFVNPAAVMDALVNEEKINTVPNNSATGTKSKTRKKRKSGKRKEGSK